ncbi:hypothetical protein QJS66_07900 [Kocuria rhizophila]|nr:hypothetical protein QJS66_07900 [Kocuria rhizophila]
MLVGVPLAAAATVVCPSSPVLRRFDWRVRCRGVAGAGPTAAADVLRPVHRLAVPAGRVPAAAVRGGSALGLSRHRVRRAHAREPERSSGGQLDGHAVRSPSAGRGSGPRSTSAWP